MRLKFTDQEIKKILKNLTIIIDSREQKAGPYKKWFDRNHIAYISKEEAEKMKKKTAYCLSHGDYSAMLPPGSIPGVDFEIWFDKDIVIEKKGNIKELAGNFSKDNGSRINTEFAHLNKYGTKVYIFLEDQLMDKHMREGKEQHIGLWRKESLYARFKTFEAAYGTVIRPISADYMAGEIYNTLYYHVRAILKQDFDINKYLLNEKDKIGNVIS